MMTPAPCLGWINDLLCIIITYTTITDSRDNQTTQYAIPALSPSPSPPSSLHVREQRRLHAVPGLGQFPQRQKRCSFGGGAVINVEGAFHPIWSVNRSDHMPTHTEEEVRDPPASNRSPTLVPAGAAASASPSPRVRCRRRAAAAVADDAVVCRSGSGIRK